MSFFAGNVSKENNTVTDVNVDLQTLIDKYVRELNMLIKSVETLGSAPATLNKLNKILKAMGVIQPERLVAAKATGSDPNATAIVNKSTLFKEKLTEHKQTGPASVAPEVVVTKTSGMRSGG